MCKKLIVFVSLFFLLGGCLIAADSADYSSGRARVVGLMAQVETEAGAITRNLDQDLALNEIAASFCCKTAMGQAFMVEALRHPVDTSTLEAVVEPRRVLIQLLVDNPELRAQVGGLLQEAQEAEAEVFVLFSDYFKGKTCPELKQLEVVKEQNPALYPLVKGLHTSKAGKTVSLVMNGLGAAGGAYATGYIGYLIYALACRGVYNTGLIVYAGYLGLVTGLSAYAFGKDYKNGMEKRDKMHALNQLITTAEKVEELLKRYGVTGQFNVSEIRDSESVAVIEGLKHSRYQQKKSRFFFTPSVHAFLYRLYQQEKSLAQLFACIAEIDTYHAIATKIVASRDKDQKFCFAQFVRGSDASLVEAHGFWNVRIPDAVTNSITEHRNIMLTGPNAGGKSTAIRALLQNILLAQTFGIAAAEQFRLTPFDVIHSYLTVSDDLLSGLSLFAAEVKRAQEIVETIKTLQPGQRFFFALDELFTGTVAEDGEACAYNFVERIAQNKNIQFVYATHFGRLKELGAQNERCANYKVDAPTKDVAGKLVFPFTLSQGASDVRVALDLARQADLFA